MERNKEADVLFNLKHKLQIKPENIFCFDTETTGLGSTAEICQLAIVNYREEVVFSEIIRPVEPISEEVIAIHGITNEQAQKARSIDYWWGYINRNFFTNKLILGYNVMYDVRMMMQSELRHQSSIYFSPFIVIDVLQFVANARINNKKWISLGEACKYYNIELDSNLSYHNAEFDAVMTMKLFRKVFGLVTDNYES